MAPSSETQPVTSFSTGARSLRLVAEGRGVTGSSDGAGLVARSMRGDAAAFEALMRREATTMYGVASLIVRDRHRRDDAVQQAMVRAWRDLPRLRDPDRFPAWLRRLVVNACYDEVRRERRHDHDSFDAVGDPVSPDHAVDVADRHQLERAFGRLPVDQRAALVLQHFLQLTHPEIAETLEIPSGTVKSRIRRGIDNLRKSFGEEVERA